MPAAFIGHGSPTNALEQQPLHPQLARAGRCAAPAAGHPGDLRALVHQRDRGDRDGAARAPSTTSSASRRDLFALDYPAPGAPEVAAEVEEIAKPTWVGQDVDSWGLDHGTWSVLTHMYPDADIPVVQLSINAMKPFDYHLELGAKLGPLRDSGVAIVGSGNVVHNLRGIDVSQPDGGFDWAHRFDEDAREVMAGAPDTLPGVQGAPDLTRRCRPRTTSSRCSTWPGSGPQPGAGADVLVDGYAYGSLSMTAYTLDLPAPVTVDRNPGSGALPVEMPAGRGQHLAPTFGGRVRHRRRRSGRQRPKDSNHALSIHGGQVRRDPGRDPVCPGR